MNLCSVLWGLSTNRPSKKTALHFTEKVKQPLIFKRIEIVVSLFCFAPLLLYKEISFVHLYI